MVLLSAVGIEFVLGVGELTRSITVLFVPPPFATSSAMTAPATAPEITGSTFMRRDMVLGVLLSKLCLGSYPLPEIVAAHC